MSSINVPVLMAVSSDIEAEEMSIGQKLTSGISSVIDKKPYLFRTSAAGSADVAVDKIVGGTVAWNQLANNFVSRSKTLGITITADNANGAITVSGTATASNNLYFRANVAVLPNHKYLIRGFSSNVSGASYILQTNSGVVATDTGNGLVFINYSGTLAQLQVAFTQGAELSFTFKPQLFDLTAMFGSTIADYIYALEQSNAGSGVAYFRKLFQKPCYAYNSGELLSVRTSAHKMVGFNQFDKSTASLGKYINIYGSLAEAGNYAVSDYIRVVPNTVYYCSHTTITSYGNIVANYDADKNFIGFSPTYSGNSHLRQTMSDTAYIRVNMMKTEVDACCVNIHWDGERDGKYAPFEQHTYALDDVELRGILKLDANNNLYADGDRYLPDGTVERRYAEIDLGAQAWTAQFLSNNRVAYVTSYASWDDAPWLDKPALTTPTPAVCVAFDHMVAQSASSWGSNVGVFTDTAATLPVKSFAIIKDSGTYADAAAFKTAMNNVKLVYLLETPTTETADPYTNPQAVSADGTEEYVDERDVPIPVGHETQYIERSSFVNNQNGAFKMTVSSNGVVI